MKLILIFVAGMAVGGALVVSLDLLQSTETPLYGPRDVGTGEDQAGSAEPRRNPAQASMTSTDMAASDDVRLADLVAEALPDDIPEESGDIRGRVVDTYGAGVSGVPLVLGAVFRASTRRPAVGGTASSDRREAVVAYLRSRARREATTFRCVSGKDGSFAFEGIPDLEYRIASESPNHQIQSGNREELKLGDEPIIQVEWRGDVRVSIVGIQDDERETVRVVAKNGPNAGDWPQRWSRSDPIIRLPVGTWTLRAQLGDRKTAEESDVVEFEVLTYGDPVEVTLVFDSNRSRIHGKVVHDGKFPIEGQVFLFEAQRIEDIPKSLFRVKGGVPIGRGEGDTYAFADRAPGNYILAYFMSDAPGLVEPEAYLAIDYAGGDLEKDLVYTGPERESRLMVRVFDSDGEPFRGKHLQLSTRSARRLGGVKMMRAVEPGLYEAVIHELSVEELEADPDGEIELTATDGLNRDKHGATRFRYGQVQEAVIHLAEPELVTIRLENADPARGTYSLSVGRASTGGFSVITTVAFDEQGNAPDTKLHAGEMICQLTVEDAASGRGSLPVSLDTLTIESGKPIIIKAPDLFDLHVESTAGERIQINSASQQGDRNFSVRRNGTCDAEGRCRIPALPKGDYDIWSEDKGKTSAKRVTVNGNLTIKL